LGCQYVIIGHSERRQLFGETDETVNKRIRSALSQGLIPIFCIGETLQEREEGRTFTVVGSQLEGGLKGIEEKKIKDLESAGEAEELKLSLNLYQLEE
jgi:triosephosphate isomerase